MADREWTRPSACSNVGRRLFYRLRLALGDDDHLVQVLDEQVTSHDHQHAQVVDGGERDALLLTAEEALWLYESLAEAIAIMRTDGRLPPHQLAGDVVPIGDARGRR